MREVKSAGFSRRSFIKTVLGAAVLSGSSAEAMVPDGLFPVSIDHAFGTTVVPARPRRVVTLGWGGEDALLALGITPVGMPRYGQFPDGVLPWVREKIGSTRPALLSQGLIDYEALVLIKPDLILAVRTNIDGQAWRRLQRIAPTVAFRSGPLQADWKEITELAGEANGVADQARDLISATERQLRDLTDAHPTIRGRSFVFGDYFPRSNALGFYLPSDGRVASLLDLGLKVAPGVASIAALSSERIGSSISLELLDTMETDILILWFPPGARQELENNKLFKRFLPVVNGGYIPLDDPLSMWVACNPSVLSIPYGFPQFVSRLEAAATGIAGRRP